MSGNDSKAVEAMPPAEPEPAKTRPPIEFHDPFRDFSFEPTDGASF